MVDIKRTDLGFAGGDLDVARAVMAEQDDVLAEIGGVVFRKGTANSKSVHDFHGLGILDLVFAGHGNTSSCEQGITKDHACHDILVLIRTSAHVVVGHRAEAVLLDELVEGNGCPCGADEFVRRDIGLDVERLAEFRNLALN